MLLDGGWIECETTGPEEGSWPWEREAAGSAGGRAKSGALNAWLTAGSRPSSASPGQALTDILMGRQTGGVKDLSIRSETVTLLKENVWVSSWILVKVMSCFSFTIKAKNK